ncbi:DUF2142 domain-containing protein [Oscillospiraceae bacterium HV4-5-C5C]|nr:DUF2142 domain-containing protein [Oscillospiraceae bacterium HV4-5-C5C]
MDNPPIINRAKTDTHIKRVICLLLILLLIAVGIIYIYIIAIVPAAKSYYSFSYLTTESAEFESMTLQSGTPITQTFHFSGEIKGFQISVVKDDIEDIDGFLTLDLIDHGNVIRSVNLPLDQINNDMNSFAFDEAYNCSGTEQYEIRLALSADLGTSLKIMNYSASLANSTQDVLTIGDAEEPGLFNISILKTNDFIYTYFVILAIISVVSTIVIYLFTFYSKRSLAAKFLVAALILGSLYLWVFPPESVPDEDTHFATTYAYTDYIFGNRFDLESSLVDESADNSIVVNGEEHKHKHYNVPARATDADFYNRMLKYPHISQYRAISENILSDSTSVNNDNPVISDNVLSTSPIVYLPGIIGMSLARILNMNGLWLMQTGRFFNMLAFILLSYIAIKKMPFGKAFLAVMTLFPVVLNIVSSYSYDALLYGTSFVFIATVLNIALVKHHFSISDLVIFTFSAIVFGSNKAIYIFILLFAFMITFENSNKKLRRKSILIQGLAGILSVALIILTTLQSVIKKQHVLVTEAQRYTYNDVLQRPLWFMRMIVKSIIHYASYYINTLIGGSLGWLEINIQMIIVFGFLLLLLLAAVNHKPDIKIRLASRFVAMISFMLVFTGIFVAGLTWTQVDNAYINGVQGRYFIPIILLLFVVFVNSQKTVKLERNIEKELIFVAFLLNLVTLASAFQTIILR